MCWHKWSKWHQTHTAQIQRRDDDWLIGMLLVQRRECEKCGKIELNKQKVEVY